MRFLVDAQLPPALARWLSAKGFEARHVLDEGLEDADDGSIWRYAQAGGWVIVTKDEDFAIRRMLRDDGPHVVWIRVGNTRKQELLQRLDPLVTEISEALERGETLVEVAAPSSL